MEFAPIVMPQLERVGHLAQTGGVTRRAQQRQNDLVGQIVTPCHEPPILSAPFTRAGRSFLRQAIRVREDILKRLWLRAEKEGTPREAPSNLCHLSLSRKRYQR